MTISSSLVALALHHQAARIFHGGLGVVDGARADDDHQAVILAVQDAVQRSAGFGRGALDRFGAGEFADQMRGGPVLSFRGCEDRQCAAFFLLVCCCQLEIDQGRPKKPPSLAVF
jgi:hypothetical protein